MSNTRNTKRRSKVLKDRKRGKFRQCLLAKYALNVTAKAYNHNFFWGLLNSFRKAI